MVVKMAASSSASKSSAPSNSDSVMDTFLYDPCSSSNGQDSKSDGDTSKGHEEKEEPFVKACYTLEGDAPLSF